jgi:hypothetical protein
LYFTFAPMKVWSVFVLLFPVSANTAITVVTWGIKKSLLSVCGHSNLSCKFLVTFQEG